jgi:hypothetical protein
MSIETKRSEYKASLEALREQRKQAVEMINRIDVDAFRLEGAIAACDELQTKETDANPTPAQDPAE